MKMVVIEPLAMKWFDWVPCEELRLQIVQIVDYKYTNQLVI